MTLQKLSRLGALVIFSFCIFGAAASAGELGYSSTGCGQAGITCGTASVDQIQANIAKIYQNGSNSSASVEQQYILGTHANAASILQEDSNNTASVRQSGSQNAAGILQSGDHLTATVGQTGTNLGVQINQFGSNASIAVTQFGTGPAGALPITITTFR